MITVIISVITFIQSITILENDCPTIKDIVSFVVPDVHHKWYDLGLQLLEDPGEEAFLQSLMVQYPNTSDRCIAVFRRWLDVNTKATWSKIIGALNEASIGLPNVSHKIERMLDRHVSYLASICILYA